jgi:hypothetical protein
MTDKKKCEECGKRGGRVMIDPYQKELFGEEVLMRLHKWCAQSRRDEI